MSRCSCPNLWQWCVQAPATFTLLSHALQKHDSYVKAFLDTGVAKVVGKPRSLYAQHADGSPLPIILSIGFETNTETKKKTLIGIAVCEQAHHSWRLTLLFAATVRPDKPDKNVPSKMELDALLNRTVETALNSARSSIKTTLMAELEGIVRRLEEYQATSKLTSAKQLCEREDSIMTSDVDSSDMETPITQNPRHRSLTINPGSVVVGRQLGVGGSGCSVCCAVSGCV